MLSKKQIDSAKQVEQVEIINLVNSKKLAFCLQMFCKTVGHKTSNINYHPYLEIRKYENPPNVQSTRLYIYRAENMRNILCAEILA